MQLPQQLQPFRARGGIARVVQIHQHRVKMLAGHLRQRLGGRTRCVQFVAFGFEQQFQCFQDVRLVVGKQEASFAGLCRTRVLACGSHRLDYGAAGGV